MKPKLIITPVGTSLLTHLIEENKNLKNHVDTLANETSAKKSNFKDEYRILSEKGFNRIKGMDLSKKDVLKKSSAEIKSLTKMKVGENKNDVVYFLSSDTLLGELCADVLSKFYVEKRIEIKEISGKLYKVISDLQVFDSDKFRKTGIKNYIEEVTKIINKPNNRNNYEIILNATGGFKAIVPYTTLLGMIFSIPIIYIFEETENIIKLPPVPLKYDYELFSKYREKFESIANDVISYDDFRKNMSNEDYERCLTLVEIEDNKIMHTGIFYILWKKFIDDNPGPIPESKKKPEDKDHLREAREEPNRTPKFESFRKKLSEYKYIDDFWYLKGCNENIKKVVKIGENNILHIYYEGIVLTATSTSSHPKHLEEICKEIEKLMV